MGFFSADCLLLFQRQQHTGAVGLGGRGLVKIGWSRRTGELEVPDVPIAQDIVGKPRRLPHFNTFHEQVVVAQPLPDRSGQSRIGGQVVHGFGQRRGGAVTGVDAIKAVSGLRGLQGVVVLEPQTGGLQNGGGGSVGVALASGMRCSRRAFLPPSADTRTVTPR